MLFANLKVCSICPYGFVGNVVTVTGGILGKEKTVGKVDVPAP
jgi:hypothetical protein